MYFPVGWPRVIRILNAKINKPWQLLFNRDKILLIVLTSDSISLWFCKPTVCISVYERSEENVSQFGKSVSVEWRPDSSMIVVVTEKGFLLYFKLGVFDNQKTLYNQVDSPQLNLRRDSAELYAKESVPALYITMERIVCIDGLVGNLVGIRDELMVSTSKGKILRFGWDGSMKTDYCLDLRRVPFCIDQQVSKAIPIVEENIFVNSIEYSPLVGGFAIVLNDGRAAFLTATTLRFDPNQVQGIWAQGIEDATCCSVNHKFRLIAFGRKNSQGIVYAIDEMTGALERLHQLVLESKDYPGSPGAVICMKWTPDGCAMAIAWEKGGVSVWSTFGALLMCTLGWDYGLHVDLTRCNPLMVTSLEWSPEGYQLWMIQKSGDGNDRILQLDFVKSALTVNPCMSHPGHLYLQGEDRLYINFGNLINKNVEKTRKNDLGFIERENSKSQALSGSKQWVVVPIPAAYLATNWPIRFTAIDIAGDNLAVAGRTGVAHYSMSTRKWKLFGNETQEKDFIVTGGILWWKDFLVLGCYSILENCDELRFYQRDNRLDNLFMKAEKIGAQLMLINILKDNLITFRADAQIIVYHLEIKDQSNGYLLVKTLTLVQQYGIDISALCVHPACVVSIALTHLRTETSRHPIKDAESIVLNVNGRVLMIPREVHQGTDNDAPPSTNHLLPTLLASCVETVWLPRRSHRDKLHLTEALWLFCGAHGMRVWLPLFPPRDSHHHAFMSKRIMLPVRLGIYPLAILFEEAILLGAANDTTLYTSDSNSIFSLPFCVLEKTSQVYLHQILRQLIRRNLGFHAWEIARSCVQLPYFPHSLELLLHEVLDEEATSKEPIPDALLPSVIEFIKEFPVYLETIVQCARKTEIALWPYLFSAAGKPKQLFQECMTLKHLDTAASYLIILQNLEQASVSRQYATLLLDEALEQRKWELSKDLVRFLRAIDPDDVESPRASFILPPPKYTTQTPQLTANEEDLSLVLGTLQVSRSRSYSTTVTPKVTPPAATPHHVDGTKESIAKSSSLGAADSAGSGIRRKKSVPINSTDNKDGCSGSEEMFIDVILQRHARRLLVNQCLYDLGHFAAYLDFHPVAWLARERDKAARVDNFVSALKQLHADFQWPYPVLSQPIAYYVQRKVSQTSSCSPGLSPVMENSKQEDPMRTFKATRDSGYTSQQTLLVNTPSLLNSDVPSGQMVEAHLVPHHLSDDASLISEDVSHWGDDHSLSIELSWSDLRTLENLSQQVPNKGSHKADIQLRYLLQLMMEASCLEWAVLIAILLRDALAVYRVIHASRSPEQSVSAVQRLRDGMVSLLQWTNVQCLGYKPFMVTIQNQISILNKVLLMKEHQRQLASRKESISSIPGPGRRSRQASSNFDGSQIAEEAEKVGNLEDKSNRSGGTCSDDLNEQKIKQSTSAVGEPRSEEYSRCTIS